MFEICSHQIVVNCMRYIEDAISPVLTYYPLRMLVCTDIASLQRLSPVAVICLKKLFWEIANSVVSFFLQVELSPYCFLDKMEIYVIGGGGDIQQFNSAKCVSGISRCTVFMIKALRKTIC
jgi:hypothetical protein